MSLRAKDFYLPLTSAESLDFKLNKDTWQADCTDMHKRLTDKMISRRIQAVYITAWDLFDEHGKIRGSQQKLKLDITSWFVSPKGPTNNTTIDPVSYAFQINQHPSVRTPWVRALQMNIKLIVIFNKGE
ncbi:hypothetical protein AH06_293 [Erwinia phage AH06]|nr:hypothetical protein AH06_293 [Erwinia phage AH06]